MKSFDDIYDAAQNRCDGIEALEEALPKPRTTKQLKKLTDAFCLSQMTARIFQAGLNRKIIDNKWPAFEEVFRGFDIDFNRMLNDEILEGLMDEKRIVRHWGKIQSVRYNAQMIHEFNEEQGGFVNMIAGWPADDIVGLWEMLKKEFKQLGGASGAYFLRRIKKDSFLLTGDVVRAMMAWGAIDEVPKNKKQKQHVQDCMNEWHAESNRAYCQISMILALSVN